MVDFRRWVLALAVITLVFSGLASAQTSSGGTGTGLSCNAFSNPNQLRSEGYTEQTGDLTIICNGGSISIAPGAPVPTANITVFVNGTVTSRLLASGGVSEALLLIDEPGSIVPGSGNTPGPVAGFGSNSSQIACGNPTIGAGPGGCVAYYQNVNSAGAPVAVGTAGSVPVMAATPALVGTATAFTQAANVFQGIVSGGQVTFQGIPILPPVSANSAREFRITNIRVNANGITGGGPIPANVTESVTTSGPGAFTVTNNGLTTGFIQTSLSTSLRTAANDGGLASGGASKQQCSSVGKSTAPSQIAFLRYTELFGSAFKTRLSTNATGNTSLFDGSSAVRQNVPGALYNSESGFIPGLALYGDAGLATFGTRLKAVFNNIPTGVSVYVANSNNGSTTTSLSQAYLITGETSPENGAALPLAQATVGTNMTLLQNFNNSATAVWEVAATQANTNETLDFAVYIVYAANPASNIPPAPSTMTVNMSYAPTPTAAFSAAAGSAASSSLPVPRFADTSTAKNVLAISICQTALLFPFVTNINGFDTGMAISNTSVDPFGTSAQSGTCTIYWYQGTTNPPSRTLGGGGIDTTTPIAGGTMQALLVSTTVSGFNGYSIAVCNFQYGHGFAFVSDLGARQLAMGYLALVIGGLDGNPRGAPAPIEFLNN